jgi:hypothetical protein
MWPKILAPQQHRTLDMARIDRLRLGAARPGPFEETQHACQAQHMRRAFAPVFAVTPVERLLFLVRIFRKHRPGIRRQRYAAWCKRIVVTGL